MRIFLHFEWEKLVFINITPKIDKNKNLRIKFRLFFCWRRILKRNKNHKVINLANLNQCSFITIRENRSFSIKNLFFLLLTESSGIGTVCTTKFSTLKNWNLRPVFRKLFCLVIPLTLKTNFCDTLYYWNW